MSDSVYYLNTRIHQYPAPNSPVTIASVQGFTFKADQLYSPSVEQAYIDQLNQLRHKFATRPAIDTLTHDIISASHLELLAKEVRAGKIDCNSVTLMQHPKNEGVVIQIHLK